VISTLPETAFAAAIRPPLATVTLPLTDSSDSSPRTSRVLTLPETDRAVTRAPAGAVTLYATVMLTLRRPPLRISFPLGYRACTSARLPRSTTSTCTSPSSVRASSGDSARAVFTISSVAS
jgi:hypothetical protein